MVYTNSGPQSTCVPLLVELLLLGETGSAQAEVDRLFGELLVIGVRDKGGYRVPPSERADIWWEGWPNDVPPGWAWGQKCPADETYPNCVNGLPYLTDKDSLPTVRYSLRSPKTRSSSFDALADLDPGAGGRGLKQTT